VIPPLADISWKPCYRIVPSRFPPVHLFARVSDSADLDAVQAVESLTNPRLRMQLGGPSPLPAADCVYGPGTAPIMAAFCHLNPCGSRFSDGSFGVYYAANQLETAVAETVYHRENFMRATLQPRIELDMRVYLTDLQSALHDLRGLELQYVAVYDRDDYSAGQALARELRGIGTRGVVYGSVRDSAGECVAAMRPKDLSNCRQAQHLCYVWDGARIAQVYEKGKLRAV
jgi:RES domain